MDHKDSAETVSYKKLRLIRKIAISSRIRLPASSIVLYGRHYCYAHKKVLVLLLVLLIVEVSDFNDGYARLFTQSVTNKVPT